MPVRITSTQVAWHEIRILRPKVLKRPSDIRNIPELDGLKEAATSCIHDTLSRLHAVNFPDISYIPRCTLEFVRIHKIPAHYGIKSYPYGILHIIVALL